MMFIKHTEDYQGREVPAGLYEAMGKFVEAGFKSGVLVSTAGLMPTAKGHRVALRAGKISVIDGADAHRERAPRRASRGKDQRHRWPLYGVEGNRRGLRDHRREI